MLVVLYNTVFLTEEKSKESFEGYFKKQKIKLPIKALEILIRPACVCACVFDNVPIPSSLGKTKFQGLV